MGSGLNDGTKPQELPARDVGRENGTGDSNLEKRDKSKFMIEKAPRSHLFDRASPLGHRVRVRFVAVSRRASAVIGLAPRSFSVNILVCKNLVLSHAGRCGDPLEVLARAPPGLLLPLHALPGSQHQGHALQRGRSRHLQFSIRALFFHFLLSSCCWSPSCTESAESTAFLKDPKFAQDHTLLALFSPETMIVHLPAIGRTIFTGPQSACTWSSP